jgi:hypothetical protein
MALGVCRAIAVVAGLASLGSACASSSDVASAGVTASRIELVRLGMTQLEVEAILGRAFSVKAMPDLGPDRVVMNYTRPTRLAYSYPMLWVHLYGGRVSEVYAKQYILWGIDDRGIYLLSAEQSAPTGQGLEQVFGD